MPYASTREDGSGTLHLKGFAGAVPSRTEAVFGAIRHAILSGELRPGQGLVETELAQLLGVSKTPVREALKTLAGAGLVTMSPYRGASVRIVDRAEAVAIYDMRLLLEPEALRRAVQRGATWGAAQDALERSDAVADPAQRSLANREFHRALYAGCANTLLVKVLDDLRDQTALVSAVAWRAEPSWREEAAEHRAILAAVAVGDAEGAATLLAAHIGRFADRHFPATQPDEDKETR
ncbi:MAG TPA: GntR family transcriptional regulator [Streptosporangiaceae bacterium]|jgi:DNA-binding GntR family transcriptional regulator|nr:GntR family transcriptional regulator [Streptosporangiaceae bacterium]